MREREYLRSPEVENNLDVARLIGADTKNKELVIILNDSEKKWAEEYLRSQGLKSNELLIAIHPGTGGTAIHFSSKWFIELCRQIIKKNNIKLMITLGPNENELMKEIMEHLKNDRIILVNNVDLRQLFALISKSNLFLSCSTGPMHIAAAFKVPVISFFAPVLGNNPERWGPWMTKHEIMKPNIGISCDNCRLNECQYYNCLDLIKAEEVIEKIGSYLNK